MVDTESTLALELSAVASVQKKPAKEKNAWFKQDLYV